MHCCCVRCRRQWRNRPLIRCPVCGACGYYSQAMGPAEIRCICASGARSWQEVRRPLHQVMTEWLAHFDGL